MRLGVAAVPTFHAPDGTLLAHRAIGSGDPVICLPGGPRAPDTSVTWAGLAGFEGPALLLTGEFDLNSPPSAVAACAELFHRGTFVEQPGAGHCPWADDPGRFVAAVASFLV